MRRASIIRVSMALMAATMLLGPVDWRGSPTDTDARIRFYQRRAAADPGAYPAYARLGEAYMRKAKETGDPRHYRDAERFLLESLRRQRNYEALYWLAAVYTAEHRFPEALAYAREAALSLPDNPDGQGVLFDVYLGLKDRSAAGVVAAKLAERPSFVSWSRMAALYEFDGDRTRARDARERACGMARAQRLGPEVQAWCASGVVSRVAENAAPKTNRESY